jgi:hypothetical protein
MLPCPARVRDYLLGGGHHLAADRRLAREVSALIPAEDAARHDRVFRIRAVQHLLEAGIRQFIDLDGGTFGSGATHDVLRDTGAKVLYIARDPVTYALGDMIVGRLSATRVLNGTGFTPVAQLLAVLTPKRPAWLELPRRMQGWINPAKPVGLLLGTLVQTLADPQATGLLARIREMLPAGSSIVLSNLTAEQTTVSLDAVLRLYRRSGHPITPRDHATLTAMLTGYELTPPGVVATSAWRPESNEPVAGLDESLAYAVVATA